MTPPDEDFERLVCDYLEGTLPESSREPFETRLRRDPASLDLLCSHALIVSGLRRIAGSTQLVETARSKALWRTQNRRAFMASLAAAAALALAAGLVLYQISVRRPDIARVEVAPHTNFTLSSPGKPSDPGSIGLGETINLLQGTARITLPDGTRCLAEAPAKLKLDRMDRLILEGGSATFDVAKGSEGFTVSTKNLEVVDLGTVFGIDDRLKGQPQVHVLKGKVRATTRSGRRESTVITVGNAAAVGAVGTLRSVPAEPSRFLLSLPAGLPAVRFPLDPDSAGRFHAEGSLAATEDIRVPDTRKSADFPSVVPGPFGSALHFSGGKQRLETTWHGIGGALPRTISLWLRIDADNPASGYILGWGLPTGKERMSDFALVYGGSNRAAIRIFSGNRWMQSSTRLDDGKWHHIAVILDNYTPGSFPSTRLVLDGTPETLTPHEVLPKWGFPAPLDTFGTVTSHPHSLPLTFGAFGSYSSAMAGSIDEVILAAGVLTETQIQALYANRPEAAGLALGKSRLEK